MCTCCHQVSPLYLYSKSPTIECVPAVVRWVVFSVTSKSPAIERVPAVISWVAFTFTSKTPTIECTCHDQVSSHYLSHWTSAIEYVPAILRWAVCTCTPKSLTIECAPAIIRWVAFCLSSKTPTIECVPVVIRWVVYLYLQDTYRRVCLWHHQVSSLSFVSKIPVSKRVHAVIRRVAFTCNSKTPAV